MVVKYCPREVAAAICCYNFYNTFTNKSDNYTYNYIDNYTYNSYIGFMDFEWSERKNHSNIEKHGISFYEAQYAFADPNRIILEDAAHSLEEKRYFCIGKISDGIVTVRFVCRERKIRIFGAGYWRKGKKLYEKENKILK